MMKKIDSVQDLIKNHYFKGEILNTPDKLKHLSRFYQIISTLWGVNDGLDDFFLYINPIAFTIKQVLSMDDTSLLSEQHEFIRLVNSLMGVSKAFTTQKQYNFFFDWFYPEYFAVIKKGFKCFSNNPLVATSLFELMKELLDTKNNRSKFDSTSLTGFLLFKEIATLILDYFTFMNLY
jgi:hypothetical protein